MPVSFWNRITKTSPLQLVVLLSLFAIIFAAFINYIFDFDGIDFNGDSYVYFVMAKKFKHAISGLMLPSREHWPYGYPALLSIPFFLFGETFKAAQWINLIAGGGLIALTGYFTLFVSDFKKLNQKKTIVFSVSALMLMIARGTMLKYQLLIMSDMMGAFWALLTILLIWKWKISKKSISLLIGGLALGFACSTRYVYILVLVPVAAILLSEFSLKKTFSCTLIFSLGFLIAIIPEVIVILRGISPGVGYGLLNDWSLKNLFTLTFESVDGHQTSHIPSILYYLVLPFRWEDFTPFGLILVCFGSYYVIHELPRWFWLSLMLWYASFYILLCGIPIQNPRIAFSLYQPLTILAAFGILWCINRWQTKWVILSLTLMTLISITFSIRYIKKLAVAKVELKETAKQVATAVEKNSRIISTSLYAVYLAYPDNIEPKSIYTMTISDAESLLSDEKKTFLAIDEEKFIPQWSKYPPGKTYQWIQKQYNCQVINKIGGFTIYEIKQQQKKKT